MAPYDRGWNQSDIDFSSSRRSAGRNYGTDYRGDYGAGPGDFRPEYGGTGRTGFPDPYAGAYGGVRSDAHLPGWGDSSRERGLSGFGTGGGSYDVNYRSGRPARGRYDRGYGQGQQGRSSDADRVRASQIMTEDPETVTPDTKVADVAKKMRDLDVGIIPVVDNEENRRLQGVITDRDLTVRVLAEGKDGKMKVSDCMSTDLEAVNKNDTVRHILDVMKRERVRRLPVTDRDGRLVGIIAQADLVVDYAGLNRQRETEVEEAIERVSEPAGPGRGGRVY